MNIIILTAHSKQSAAMLDVKFTSTCSSMEEKQYFAFLAACCRFRKSKVHLGHWIEVSDHLRNFFQWVLCRSFAKAIISHRSSIELLVNLTSNMAELVSQNLLFLCGIAMNILHMHILYWWPFHSPFVCFLPSPPLSSPCPSLSPFILFLFSPPLQVSS